MTTTRPRKHGLHRLAGRLVSGRRMDGQPHPDSTFLARGVEGTPWARLAGWQRAAARLAVLAALWGLWKHRHATEWVLTLTGGPALGVACWTAWRSLRSWRHVRELVRPLSAALAPFLGISPREVESGLTILRGFEDTEGGEHIGSLQLPDHWAATADLRARVEEVISARFGMGLRYHWATTRHPMMVNFTRAPVPPDMVPLAEVRQLADALPAHMTLLGLDASRDAHNWDTSAEDPHMAIHGGSRRGKTTLLLLIAAQDLRKGAERVTAIDPKRVSLTALAGHPAVRLYNDPRDIAAMWQGVADFRALVDERYEELDADPTAEFPRALLIIDEVSQFAGMSLHHWRAIKTRQDPAQPPVWADVAASVWQGGQV